jgi:hypothetical protein
VHVLVKIVAGLPVMPDHLIGDVSLQEAADLIEEALVLGAELDA